jgi:hypothetical protein
MKLSPSLSTFLYFSFCLLFFSCDPLFDIDFKVENNTSSEISVIIKDRSVDQNLDTIIITSEMKVEVYNFSGVGHKNNDAYALLDSIPFNIIMIKQGSKIYNKEPKDKTYWIWTKDQAESVLTIRQDDFD